MKKLIKHALIALLAGILIFSSVGCNVGYKKPTMAPDTDFAILTRYNTVMTGGSDGAVWNGKTYKIKDALKNYAAVSGKENFDPTFERFNFVGDKIYFSAYQKKTENKKRYMTFYFGTATAPTWEDMTVIYEMPVMDITDYKYGDPHVDHTTFKDYYVFVRSDGETVFVNMKSGVITEKSDVKAFMYGTAFVYNDDYLATWNNSYPAEDENYIEFVLYDEDLNEYRIRVDKANLKSGDTTCVYGDIIFWGRYVDGKFGASNALNFKTGEKPDEKALETAVNEITDAYEKSTFDQTHASVTIGDETYYSKKRNDNEGFTITRRSSEKSEVVTIAHLEETSPEFAEVTAPYKAFGIAVHGVYDDGFIICISNRVFGTLGYTSDTVPYICFRYDIAEDKAYYIGYVALDVHVESVIKVTANVE